MSKHVGKRWRKLCTFSILSSKRRITPTKMTQIITLQLEIRFIKGKSHTKCQLNISNYVGEKCRKLFISSILRTRQSKIEKVPRDVRIAIVRKNNDKFGKKDWSQQVEHMQVPNDMGPGVRRSKLSQSVCYTRRKCSMETSYKSVKG